MLPISQRVAIPLNEIEFRAVLAGGAGGQNVNKVATAVHLRFDIAASSLPDFYKQRLLKLKDRRISKEGIVVIKAQRHRHQEKNREEALLRLQALVRGVAQTPKKRKPTRAPAASRRKRLDAKRRRGRIKSFRGKVGEDKDY
jgi:ribosome-associated protein